MKKHFLLLVMALMSITAWATDIKDTNISLGNVVYGAKEAPKPFVVWSGETLTPVTHYTVDENFYEDAACKIVAKPESGPAYTINNLPVGTWYMKISGNSVNGFDGETSKDFKVTKAPLTVTVTPSATMTKVYDGTTGKTLALEAITFTFKGSGYVNKETDDVLEWKEGFTKLSWTYTNANAGDQKVDFDGLKADNYEITYSDVFVKITQKPLAASMVTTATLSEEYKGAAFTPATDLTVTVKEGTTALVAGTDYTIKTYDAYTAAEGSTPESWGTEVATPTNAGTYYVAVEGGATNYSGKVYAGTFEIKKANLTVKADDQTMVYNGKAVSEKFDPRKFTLIGLKGSDKPTDITGANTVEMATADLAKTVVDNYTINPTEGAFVNANYNIFFQPGTFSITPAPLTIAATAETVPIGVTPTCSFTITGAIGSEEANMKAETYKVDGKDVAGGNIKVVKGESVQNKVDEYEEGLVVTYNAESPVFANYTVTATNAKLTIVGGTIIITVNPQTMVYGETEPDWANPVKGKDYFLNGIGDEETLKVTLTRDKADKKGVGTYDVTATYGALPEGYSDVNVVNSKFTITARPINVTAKAQSLAVGRTADNLNLSEITIVEGEKMGLAAGDKVEDVLKLVFATSVNNNVANTYKGGIVVALTTKASDNYTLTQTPGDLTIIDAIVLNRVAKDNFSNPSLNDAAEVIEAANGAKKTVTFGDFEMAAERWYSMVLPFDTDVKTVSDAFGYAVVDKFDTNGGATDDVYFRLHMGDLPANKPFIVKIYKAKNMNTVTFDGVAHAGVDIVAPANEEALTLEDTKGNKFIGTYAGKYGFEGHQYVFSISTGKISGTGATTYLRPLGAYVEMPEQMHGMANAPSIFIEEPDGTTTAINTLSVENKKMDAEGWFTVGGMKLNAAPTQKGVYIKNGKKFIVK